ncbi:MAG: hypothetical protein Q7T44_06000 [Parvibaculum sp.]|nr:hypothetical protein [Parvibaculum sp.]
MDIAITLIMLVVGYINFHPLIGIVSVARLQALYGPPIEGADMAILMRHRALLFGILGGFIMYAAFVPELRVLAFVAGFTNMLGFVVIARLVGGYRSRVARVERIDMVASALLAVALVLHLVR